MNYNKAVIVGRLTRDPESKPLPSGQPVVNFGVATNRVWTNQNGAKQEATEFHNIVAFGKLAEICSRYLTKGRLVLIEGRLRTHNWQDQNNIKHYRTEIIADNMQMGPRSDFGSASSPADRANTPANSQQAASVEEIPIIEADETANEPKPETQEAQVENQNQVDVKNIPF